MYKNVILSNVYNTYLTGCSLKLKLEIAVVLFLSCLVLFPLVYIFCEWFWSETSHDFYMRITGPTLRDILYESEPSEALTTAIFHTLRLRLSER